MKKKKLIIFGAGNHAKMISSIFKTHFKTLAFIVTNRKKNKDLNKIKIYEYDKKMIKKFIKLKNCYFFIGIGDNKIRKKILKILIDEKLKVNWAKLISKKALIADNVKIGDGSLVMPGCIINNDVNIRDHCIINTGSILEHDNKFENFSSSGPGVITGGNVFLGEASHIGIGSIVREKITINKNVFIGGSSFVNKDLKTSGLYFGIPAKKIKNV